MSVLQWDQVGDRLYEGGCDRGVLYLPDGSGVPWNGLTSVDEANNNTVTPVYFDGIKFNDIVTIGEFVGTMRAFTYPDEFYPFDGMHQDQLGVFLTHQVPQRFGLAYRTLIGNDVEGFDHGYKIHLVYNLTANPATISRKSLSLEVEPEEFEWSISAIPETVAGHRPTSHLIFDSRHMDSWLLADLEEILYGSDTTDPTLPSLQAMITFIRKWDRLIIADNGDGTWSAITQDESQFTDISPTQFEFDAENATYLDADTYEVSSSDKNDEDVTP